MCVASISYFYLFFKIGYPTRIAAAETNPSILWKTIFVTKWRTNKLKYAHKRELFRTKRNEKIQVIELK